MAEDRKERLRKLAAQAGRNQEQQQPAFRNYAPIEEEEPTTKRQKTQKEPDSALELALKEAQQQETKETAVSSSIVDMAPKKINWDLKKDVQEKLDKLERRTQKAIVELLRERLEREAATNAID